MSGTGPVTGQNITVAVRLTAPLPLADRVDSLVR